MELFDFLRLQSLVRTLKKQKSKLLMENAALKGENELLWKQLARRDQKISELIQKNGSTNPDPLNFEFPGTEKYFDDFWNKLQKL